MTCSTCQRKLYDYLDGTLSPRRRTNVETHLAGCPACQQAYAAERALAGQLAQMLHTATAEVNVAPNLVFKVNAALTDTTSRHPVYREVRMRTFSLRKLLEFGLAAAAIVFVVVVSVPVLQKNPEKARMAAARVRGGATPLNCAIESPASVATALPAPTPVAAPMLAALSRGKGQLGYGRASGMLNRKMASSELASLADESLCEMDTRLRADAPAQPAEQFNTEDYSRIYENEFLEARNNPLSTFSIDVDTAAYANMRRFLAQGQRPPKDAVRIEELINYFHYDYPQPTGPQPFTITTEGAPCPWNTNNTLVMIGLQGKAIAMTNLPPNNLVFLLDVSGSMDMPNKLPLVKSAIKLLVNELRPIDRVALVVYAGAAGLVLDSTAGDEKARITAALDQLEAGGATAGGAGVQLAYTTAKQHFLSNGNNRVILATDGDFNVGASSDAALVRMIEEKRNDGIYLTVLGFGMGNYKDNKMEQLADKGNGNYAYIDTILEARKVLVQQLGATLLTIAKDVKLQIEFNPAAVKAYRLIGYENRMLKAEDFNDDKKDAGELGAGHSVTAFYELVPAGSTQTFASVDPLKYQTTTPQASDELLTVKFRYKRPDETNSLLLAQALTARALDTGAPSQNFRFASAVAEFGLLLRDSQYKGTAGFDAVLERARGAKGADNDGYRAEFIRLVEHAQLLPQN